MNPLLVKRGQTLEEHGVARMILSLGSLPDRPPSCNIKMESTLRCLRRWPTLCGHGCADTVERRDHGRDKMQLSSKTDNNKGMPTHDAVLQCCALRLRRLLNAAHAAHSASTRPHACRIARLPTRNTRTRKCEVELGQNRRQLLRSQAAMQLLHER